jgi:enoyl-[acyl-carrier-protein] reductase (NADH)
MMGTTMFPGTFDQKAYDIAARRNPLRKVVEAADVANSIIWLLSDLSHTVTGREMVVDAGATTAH